MSDNEGVLVSVLVSVNRQNARDDSKVIFQLQGVFIITLIIFC